MSDFYAFCFREKKKEKSYINIFIYNGKHLKWLPPFFQKKKKFNPIYVYKSLTTTWTWMYIYKCVVKLLIKFIKNIRNPIKEKFLFIAQKPNKRNPRKVHILIWDISRTNWYSILT